MPNHLPFVGRLAPSPTGAQHVGNARTYLLAWLALRSQGGKVVLRMEDIDSPRVKVGAAEQALVDLRWLGLDWDEGPDVGGDDAPYVQTQRLQLYADALAKLQDAELVYPCTCSRSDVQAAASAPHVGDEGPAYAGTCAHRRVADAEALAHEARSFGWRFRCTAAEVTFDDEVAGQQTAHGNQWGDFVVAKGDGTPAYQLAVVVDDQAMGINQVLRGNDLIPSTLRQLQLYAAFGWEAPHYAHVPLVIGVDGRRLAKRHGDTRISVLRERGIPAANLLGLLAWSCGLRPNADPVTAQDLLAGFSLDPLPREPWVLTQAMWEGLLNS